jgi:GAF domain-containing protein/HAMP domain-containing protein
VNRTGRNQNFYERLLQSRGGRYIILAQSVSQLISFLAAVIGIFYILVTANLNTVQIQELFVSVIFFVGLVNLLIQIFTASATQNARLRLDHIIKGKPLPLGMEESKLEMRAWRETVTLTWRYAVAELATAYIMVVIPAVLFMIRAGGANPIQAAHVAIGGLISGTFVVVQNTLALDRILTPVRQILLPRDFDKQISTSGMRAHTRLQIVVAVLVISAVALLIPLGYQTLVNFAGDAASTSKAIRDYMVNAMVILSFLVIFGLILSYMLSQSISDPIKEMEQAMGEISKGNFNERARIITSDETMQLIMRLNQMIEQLEISRSTLERQVEERTSELTRRTEELQAASQVAREAASQQDLNQLLERTVILISARFGFYHTGIFLLNENRDYVILKAASSEEGKRMIEKGHRLAIGQQGIVGAAAYQNRPRVAMDVGADGVYFNNPDLPTTRAEAAFPLTVRNEVIGVLDIQSTSIDAFTQNDVELLQTLADQIALAIQNARLIEETRDAMRQLEASNAEGVRRAWTDRARAQKKNYRYTPSGVITIPQSETLSATWVNNRISIPIGLRGQRIGNITLSRKNDSPWGEEDRALATEVASQIGLALENARLLDEAQRRAAQEQAISDLAARLGRSVDPDSILQAAVRELHMLPNVEEVSVFISSSEESRTDTEQRNGISEKG